MDMRFCKFANSDILIQKLTNPFSMRLLWILPLTLFITMQTLSAQETTGFSDPDRIEPLLDYRLPAWGYSTFYWDFNLNGNRQVSDFDNNNRSLSEQYNVRLAPVYFRFHESEQRSGTFSLSPQLFFQGGSSESDSNNTERSERNLQIGITTNLTETNYRNNSDLFFRYNLSGAFFQQDSRDERFGFDASDIDNRSFSRRFNPRAEVGVGYGRLRNVTPMIRALRLDERLQALAPGQRLSSSDLISASQQFTRQQGYSKLYDRPAKHFWDDMDSRISTDLSTMNAFDLLYLTDTSAELTGQRREGWSTGIFAGINYRVQYNRFENNLTGSEISNVSTEAVFEPRAEAIWSKNLSLEHQLSASATYQYLKPISDSSSASTNRTDLDVAWLYTITDRIFTNTSAGFTRNSSSSASESINSYRAATQINYFIENRVSLFGNVQYLHTDFSQFSNSQILFGAGIRYYITRSLF